MKLHFRLTSVKQKYKMMRGEILLPINVGKRIAIIGPMASGKSTLAVKFGAVLKIPVYHLDQLCFLPGTFWAKRPEKEFKKLHDEIISHDSWIMEGNFETLLPQRLSRASTLIWLNPPFWRCVFNFYKRFFRKNRHNTTYPGRLQNAREEFTICQLKYIFIHKFHRKILKKMIKEHFNGKVFCVRHWKDVKTLFPFRKTHAEET
ncbi:MAG: hypothetical protein LBF94_01020 [Puniceicoccales bacterium]|jgi:adenylate kinase family enzyme|nr:hypothetical protein [Puniceicoccales bacterium]